MSTHTNERDTDGMVPQWISRPSSPPVDVSHDILTEAEAVGGMVQITGPSYADALRAESGIVADTPDESQFGEHPDLNDRMEAGFAKLRETAANSLVRMDAAEAAADALSKWAHLLPTYATEAREAAASWRLARSL